MAARHPSTNVGDSVESEETGRTYVFVKLLRRARAGEMWLGQYSDTKDSVVHVAIKVVSEEYCNPRRQRPSLAENPVQEARTLQFLNYHGHPNISVVLDVFRANSRLYVVCEFLDGGDLLELVLQNTRFREDSARYFFQALMSGVAYMHKLQVVHLDLSLENVVVNKSFQKVHIIDFGLSNQIKLNADGVELAVPGGARGKASYLAPEVLAGAPFSGTAADIWCCGIVLWVMLTGAPLFESGPHKQDRMYRFVAMGQLDKILTSWNMPVTPAAQDLLKRMLNMNPAERPTAVQVLQHPWFTVGATGGASGAAAAAPSSGTAAGADGDLDMG